MENASTGDKTPISFENAITSGATASLRAVLSDKDFMSTYAEAKGKFQTGIDILPKMSFSNGADAAGLGALAGADAAVPPEQRNQPLKPGDLPIDPEKLKHITGVPLGKLAEKLGDLAEKKPLVHGDPGDIPEVLQHMHGVLSGAFPEQLKR